MRKLIFAFVLLLIVGVILYGALTGANARTTAANAAATATATAGSAAAQHEFAARLTVAADRLSQARGNPRLWTSQAWKRGTLAVLEAAEQAGVAAVRASPGRPDLQEATDAVRALRVSYALGNWQGMANALRRMGAVGLH